MAPIEPVNSSPKFGNQVALPRRTSARVSTSNNTGALKGAAKSLAPSAAMPLHFSLWPRLLATTASHLHSPAPWPALTETHPMPALEAAAKREAPPPPDLVALRREIIERREGRLAERLPWRRSNAPLALGDEKTAETEKYGASGDGDAAAKAKAKL